MDNNKDLFEYITKELYSHGGDGNVMVLFKQQEPLEVAKEFFKYLVSVGNTGLTNHNTDHDQTRFSDMSNEWIFFERAYPEGVDFKQELREKYNECDGVGHAWRRWDTFIITW